MPPTEQAALPHRSTDARGRAIPLSAEAGLRRAGEEIRALDALDEIGDAEEQRETLEFLMEAIDQDRLSYRKRFR